MIIVLMGVAGSGKSTIGDLLASKLGWELLEGDSLHSPENVARMSRGEPLTDEQRESWLGTLHERIRQAHDARRDLILTCSALKGSYRSLLSGGLPITWIYLNGSEPLIRARLEQRVGHYMRAEMLRSQFDILEEPVGAITVAVDKAPSEIVEEIVVRLMNRGPA